MNKQPVLIVIFILTHSCCGTPEQLKKLREKANNNMKENVQVITERKRGTSIRFVPQSDVLYPGLDKTKAARVNKLWDNYYECQRALYESVRRLVVPEALAYLEGSNAVLECEICESPRDMFLELKWVFSSNYSSENLTEIKETASKFIKDNNLNIYNIGENHGGLYMCQKGNHTSRPYIVHVFKSEPSRKVVSPGNEEGEHPAPEVNIPDIGVKVITRWTDWTQCSRCDQIGKRYRRGICTVIYDKNQTSVLKVRRKTELPPVQIKSLDLNQEQTTNTASADTSSLSEALTSSTITSSLNVENTTFTTVPAVATTNNVSIEDDLAILDIFEEGIPCRSKMLSENIQNHTAIVNRRSEVLVAYCKIPCAKDVVFVVVDDKGRVLETANNSAGVYSVLQGLPKDTPAVSRAVVYARYNQPFKVHCPGNHKGDIPIEWYVGRMALTNKMLDKETAGRVSIDEYNRICFNPALFEDSRVFSCWQHKDLVGTVRLIVEKVRGLKFEKPVMVLGTIVIFGVFFWVYYKAFTLS